LVLHDRIRKEQKRHARVYREARGQDHGNAFRSAWVSRKLGLLRAHGLITKITGTHRYQLTAAGRKAITTILTALRSTVRQLTPMAA
jgi:hypothetical protein